MKIDLDALAADLRKVGRPALFDGDDTLDVYGQDEDLWFVIRSKDTPVQRALGPLQVFDCHQVLPEWWTAIDLIRKHIEGATQ